jgi:hypothetical protein
VSYYDDPYMVKCVAPEMKWTKKSAVGAFF